MSIEVTAVPLRPEQLARVLIVARPGGAGATDIDSILRAAGVSAADAKPGAIAELVDLHLRTVVHRSPTTPHVLTQLVDHCGDNPRHITTMVNRLTLNLAALGGPGSRRDAMPSIDELVRVTILEVRYPRLTAALLHSDTIDADAVEASWDADELTGLRRIGDDLLSAARVRAILGSERRPPPV